MTHAKGVVLTFVSGGKGSQAVFLSDARHAFAPLGQDLMWIGLMADVPQ